MSVKDDIEAVNRIEEKFDLSRLTYQGEKILARHSGLPAIRTAGEKAPRQAKPENLSKWKRLRTILDSVLNYYFHDRKQSRFKLKKAEMLFVFDMLPKVKNSLNGKWMNKFAEGIFPYLDPSKIFLLHRILPDQSVQNSEEHQFLLHESGLLQVPAERETFRQKSF